MIASPSAARTRNSMTTVGLLYPGHSAEDDFPALEARLTEAGRPLGLPLQHTSVGVDAHQVDALLDLGSDVRLADGARELTARASLDSIMWACTSGSFVFGPDGARRQVDELSRATGLPASSTSFAFLHAVQHLGFERVCVAASYPDDVARAFVRFLAAGGVEVTAMRSNGIYTAAEVGTLGREQVIDLVRRIDTTGAQAVLVPDTAMHSLAWLPDLEAAAGMPVLTANQVTIWEGLRVAGRGTDLPGLGTLFAVSTQES